MMGNSELAVNSVAELQGHCSDPDVARVVDSLSGGITRLRSLMLKRVHEDVEHEIGMDSMIAPVSLITEQRQAKRTKLEIEMYAIVVIADEISRGSYVDCLPEWSLDWLLHLRMGNDREELFKRRIESYQVLSANDRRLKFLNHLQRAMPESARAPLVLFRLFPRALRIVAAMAFGDAHRALALRGEQCILLPAINDCSQCHGQVLDNGDMCPLCGNPIWEFAWLNSD
jgi:hypothetical protein